MPGDGVFFEVGVGSPWSLISGKIKEPKLKSIIEDGLKSYLFNKVSRTAWFLQRSFNLFIRIKFTGYKGQWYLSSVLHSTRCINVTSYNPVIDWLKIKGKLKFY